MKPLFRGKVVRGKFIPDNPEAFQSEFTKYEGKVVYVTVDKETNRNTLKLHKYYRGVIIPILAEHTGYSKDEMHKELARKFLSEPLENGLLYIRSTADLSTTDFLNYIEAVKRFASELDCYIPNPNEVNYD